jgi:hypothetical protein
MRKFLWMILPILLAGQMSPATAKKSKPTKPAKTVATQPVVAKPAPKVVAPVQPGLSPISDRLLAAHNQERGRLGLAPLTWSTALAQSASVWAQHLAKTSSFDHAPPSKPDEGENLWMGTKGAYTPEDMVGLWIDEKRMFKRGLFPNVSTTGQWSDVGHYTQLIWSRTARIGCAIASNSESDFLVCRYDPPGNWIGESPFGLAKSAPTQQN